MLEPCQAYLPSAEFTDERKVISRFAQIQVYLEI